MTHRSRIARELRKAVGSMRGAGSFCCGGSEPVFVSAAKGSPQAGRAGKSPKAGQVGKSPKPGRTGESSLPGLEIEGFGPVELPLTAAAAERLEKLCTPAAHGQGTRTVVDPKVRSVLRMGPERLRLTHPEWPAFLTRALERTRYELGLGRQRLVCALYDLLLYRDGDFFLPHRDGEKLPRMVATLTIVLPSVHEGGTLVVRHAGQERRFDFGGAAGAGLVQYAAFYTDCEHEVLPVESGRRLCLVYNVQLAAEIDPHGPDVAGPQLDEVERILRNWSDGGGPTLLAVGLKHKYTSAGLEFAALKGLDRRRAALLTEAARRTDCRAHLALFTLHETGMGEEDYDPPGRGGRGRPREVEDEDEGEYDGFDESGGGRYVMQEVFDTKALLTDWTDPHGNRPAFGPLPLEPGEFVAKGAAKSIRPDEEYEGYTGNEGMTLERWYRHTVLVLWPRNRELDVLARAGLRPTLRALHDLLDRGRRPDGSLPADVLAEGRARAGAILRHWAGKNLRLGQVSDGDRLPWSEHGRPLTPAADVPAMLEELDDPALLSAYLAGPAAFDPDAPLGQTICDLLDRHDLPATAKAVRDLFDATAAECFARNADLLERLSLKAGSRDDRRDLCGKAAERWLKRLIAAESPQGWPRLPQPRYDGSDRDHGTLPEAARTASMIVALSALDDESRLERLFEHIRAAPKWYPLDVVQVPAALLAGERLQAAGLAPLVPHRIWVAEMLSELAERIRQAPLPPPDQRRASNLPCQCRLCRRLANFLDDPQEKVHEFRMVQESRKHLEHTIRQAGCDLDLVTCRMGSPHTLVCTKNQASHLRARAEYEADVERSARLVAWSESVRPGGKRR